MHETCAYCAADLHNECSAAEITDSLEMCCCPSIEEGFISENEGRQPSFLKKALADSLSSALKEDEDVTDITSTGRKRAAQMYPIEEGMLCEWAFLAKAGGGVYPLVGCNGTELSTDKGKHARHHGPDKNTVNNEVGNVHRICQSCHNRWHSLNDPYYGSRQGTQPFIPLVDFWVNHDNETAATPDQQVANTTYWNLKTKEKELLNYKEFVKNE